MLPNDKNWEKETEKLTLSPDLLIKAKEISLHFGFIGSDLDTPTKRKNRLEFAKEIYEFLTTA